MSLYVLDTDTLTLYERAHPVVTQKVAGHDPADVVIAVITVEEQLTGWYTFLRGAKTPVKVAAAYDRLLQAVKFLGSLPILPFNAAAIGRYQNLQSLKLNVGKQDLRIAAIALEHGAVVVTRNLRDFQRVPGLTVEDWTV